MSIVADGVIEYVTDNVGVEGRETFQITALAEGGRLLRAHSEMYNDQLIRNTLLTVDESWRPLSAQLHLIVHDTYVGAGQYRFADDHVRLDAHTAARGYESLCENLSERTPAFVGHAVQNDAWLYAALAEQERDGDVLPLDRVVISSRLPNGGDGPALLFSDQLHRYLGDETIETSAGRFDTGHYEFLVSDKPPIHYWVTGTDYLLVRARWDLLRQTYELVSLNRR